jgi:hypothetical protein
LLHYIHVRNGGPTVGLAFRLLARIFVSWSAWYLTCSFLCSASACCTRQLSHW